MATNVGNLKVNISFDDADQKALFAALRDRLRQSLAEQATRDLIEANRRSPLYWAGATLTRRFVYDEWPADVDVIHKIKRKPRRKSKPRARKAQPAVKPKRAISMEPL